MKEQRESVDTDAQVLAGKKARTREAGGESCWRQPSWRGFRASVTGPILPWQSRRLWMPESGT